MQHNRISQAWTSREPAAPPPGSFLAIPLSGGAVAWQQLYQLAHEQAQAATRSARPPLPAVSLN
jgi:hypothetical protein